MHLVSPFPDQTIRFSTFWRGCQSMGVTLLQVSWSLWEFLVSPILWNDSSLQEDVQTVQQNFAVQGHLFLSFIFTCCPLAEAKMDAEGCEQGILREETNSQRSRRDSFSVASVSSVQHLFEITEVGCFWYLLWKVVLGCNECPQSYVNICGVTREPLTLRLIWGDVNAKGQSDDHGAQAHVPYWWSSTIEIDHCINYLSTKGLQPHLRTKEIDFPQNLLFEKTPSFNFNHIHSEVKRKRGKTPWSCDHPMEGRNAG